MWPAPLTLALVSFLAAQSAGMPPAYVAVTGDHVALGNQYLERGLDVSGRTVRTAYIENKLTKKRMPVESLEFVIRIDEKTELSQADFCMTSRPSTIDVPGGGKRVIFQLSHEKLDFKVKVVYEVLPDDFYARKWLEIALPPTQHLLNTIDVERLRIQGASLFLAGPEPKNTDWVQKFYEPLTSRLGQPVFADNFFLGVEYPAAENSIDPAGWIAMRQYIGRKMGQQTVETKKAVIFSSREASDFECIWSQLDRFELIGLRPVTRGPDRETTGSGVFDCPRLIRRDSVRTPR